MRPSGTVNSNPRISAVNSKPVLVLLRIPVGRSGTVVKRAGLHVVIELVMRTCSNPDSTEPQPLVAGSRERRGSKTPTSRGETQVVAYDGNRTPTAEEAKEDAEYLRRIGEPFVPKNGGRGKRDTKAIELMEGL